MFAMLCVFGGMTLATVVAFRLQSGSWTEATMLRCSSIAIKKQALQATPSPKLVFVGGSSVHRGVNAELVSSALNLRAVNAGTFAAFGPKLMLETIKNGLKPGDTVVMMFEYDLFWRDKPTTTEIDYAIGCDQDYLDGLPMTEQLSFALGSNLFRPFNIRQFDRDREIERQRSKITPFGDARLEPSNFKMLSKDERARLKLFNAPDIAFDPDSRDVRAIAEFVSWANRHDIRVLASWPNIAAFPNPQGDRGIRQISSFYRNLGVQIVGPPQMAMAPVEDLYDGQYHLNPKGIISRTEKLIGALRPVVCR